MWILISCSLSLSFSALATIAPNPCNVAIGSGATFTDTDYASRFRNGRESVTIIIGTGNIVLGRENGYARAAQLAAEKTGARFFIVDNSDNWKGVDRSADMAKLEAMRLPFLDTRPEKDSETEFDVLGRILAEVSPDTVMIATRDETHVQFAREVLLRDPGVRRVVVEKPLSHELADAEQLEQLLIDRGWQNKVFVVDHFRARFPKFSEPFLHRMFAHLGGAVAWSHIYYLEDGSGAPFDGSIENANREVTLNHGVAILDLEPHALGLIQLANPALTALRLQSVVAGKYTGVKGNADQPSVIRDETFGRVRYGFSGDVMGHRMDFNITAYMGKNIKGHSFQDVQFVGNVKFIFLRGIDPRRAILMDLGSTQQGSANYFQSNAVHLLELGSDDKTWTLPPDHIFSLEPFPYHALLRMEVSEPDRNHGVMPFHAALQMQRLLAEAIARRDAQYPDHGDGKTYLRYPGGMAPTGDSAGREALMLNDLLRLFRQKRVESRLR